MYGRVLRLGGVAAVGGDVERVDAREVANVLRVVLVVGRHDVTRVARDAP